MELYSVLVTGANRGIGLEFVRQLSALQKSPKFIFATYRSKASVKALEEIKNASKSSKVVLIEMDVTKLDEIVAARKIIEQETGENGLTLLINNAARMEPQAFPDITEENLLLHFITNTIGPVRIFQEMLPLLEKSASRPGVSSGMSTSKAAVLNVSSKGGCITRARAEILIDSTVPVPGYKTSKAALNMAMRVIAANVKSKGILVILMCPGWVKTDMGTDHAQTTPEESISDMIQTLSKSDESRHGSFMDRLGNPYDF